MASSYSPACSRATRALVVLSAWLVVVLGFSSLVACDDTGFPSPIAAPAGPPRPAPRAAGAALSLPMPRKILRPAGNNNASNAAADGGFVARTARMDEGCAGAEDISVSQGRAHVLPNGIPAYNVEVTNQCLADDCAIAGIHVRCGWFSSVVLVDPSKFRRVRHNDCLINDGRPLRAGEVVSFQYANSFPYRLSVTVATCVDPNTIP